MSNISVDYDVLNQKGSPAWYSDVYANIPTAGYKGRMFISTDTYAFYRDTGTGWDLIGGPGTGTITGSGATGQVSFFNGSSTLAGNNNLFWDNTNSRLGINTTTPGQPLDIHSTGNTLVQLNNTTTANSNISFQNQNVAKWRVGNVYNAGANSFDIQNANLLTNAISINSTTNNVNFGSTIGNGTFTYTLPGATGTLALTSDLTGYVTLATTQTITAEKTFTSTIKSNAGILIQNGTTTSGNGYLGLGANTNELQIGLVGATHRLLFTNSASYNYTFPSATGTLALTSDLSSYLPLAGGTLTGALNGTSASFSSIVAIGTTSTGFNPAGLPLVVGSGSGNTGLTIFSGTSSSGSIHFADTETTGSGSFSGFINYSHTTDSMQFGTASTERMRITSGGNVGIGTIGTSNVKLYIQSDTNTTASFSLGCISSTNNLFLVRGNGQILTGDAAASPYNNTIANVANLYVDGTGTLYRSTASSKRFKENIQDWNGNGLDTILLLKPKTFTYKADYYKNPNLVMLGLIAEEVAEVSSYLAEYKNEDRTGQVENVRYATIVVPLIKAIQELNEKLVRNNIN